MVIRETERIVLPRITTRMQVETVEPGREVVVRTTSAPRPLRRSRKVEVAAGGTLLTLALEVEAPLGEHLVVRYLARGLERSLARLKALMECGDGAD